MGVFAHDPRQEGDVQLVKDMGDAIDESRVKPRITDDDLLQGGGGGVVFVDGLDVREDLGLDPGQLFEKDPAFLPAGRAIPLLKLEGQANLVLQTVRELLQRTGLIPILEPVEAGKEDGLHQLEQDDRAFPVRNGDGGVQGGRIDGVDPIQQPAKILVLATFSVSLTVPFAHVNINHPTVPDQDFTPVPSYRLNPFWRP